MDYDELLKAGRIRREKISNDEIRHALERAKRDLKTARKVMASDWDWGFSIAYDAVLQASRAYMFAQGYRPASAEGHKNTFAFMRVAMGKEHEDLLRTSTGCGISGIRPFMMWQDSLPRPKRGTFSRRRRTS